MRGQSMPIGDEKKALIFVLQAHPVLQHAVIVAEVQLPGRTHARQDALMFTGNSAHAPAPLGPTSVHAASK